MLDAERRFVQPREAQTRPRRAQWRAIDGIIVSRRTGSEDGLDVGLGGGLLTTELRLLTEERLRGKGLAENPKAMRAGVPFEYYARPSWKTSSESALRSGDRRALCYCRPHALMDIGDAPPPDVRAWRTGKAREEPTPAVRDRFAGVGRMRDAPAGKRRRTSSFCCV